MTYVVLHPAHESVGSALRWLCKSELQRCSEAQVHDDLLLTVSSRIDDNNGGKLSMTTKKACEEATNIANSYARALDRLPALRSQPSMLEVARSLHYKLCGISTLLLDEESEEDPTTENVGGQVEDLVLKTLHEESSVQSAYKREQDLKRGAFKLEVMSVQRNPADPTKPIAGGASSGSGFLASVDDMLAVADGKQQPVTSGGGGGASTKTDRWVVVTNAHVVRDAVKVFLISALYPNERIVSRVVAVCYDLDLAFVQPCDFSLEKNHWHGDKFRPFELADEMRKFIQRDEETPNDKRRTFAQMMHVIAVGFPLGSSQVQMTDGLISGYEQLDGRPMLQISVPINRGSSGGALVDDRGRVIGVTSSGVPSASNVGFAIPVQNLFSVARVVDEHLQKYFSTATTTTAEKTGQKNYPVRVIDVPYWGVEFVRGDAYARVRGEEASERTTVIFSVDDKKGYQVEFVLRAEKSSTKVTGPFIGKIDPISILQRPLPENDNNKTKGSAGDTPQIMDRLTHFDGFAIDDTGNVRDQTYPPERVSLMDLFRTMPFGDVFTVTFIRGRRSFTNRYRFEARGTTTAEKDEYAIRSIRAEDDVSIIEKHRPLSLPDQLALGQLSLELVEALSKTSYPSLSVYARNERRAEPRVVVLEDATDAFNPGEVIVTIDDETVHTLEKAREIFAKASGRFVEIVTESGSHGLFFVDPVLAEHL
jgi:S1-C subfamily serine protease